MNESQIIKCPHCNNSLEIEPGWIGRKAKCSYCANEFIIASKSASPKSESVLPLKRPKMLWVGVVWLYLILGSSLVGNIVQGNIKTETIGMGCLVIYGVYSIQQGSTLARLLVTILFALASLMSFRMGVFVGLFFAAILLLPIIFLWLPQCNAWFREKKKERHRS